MGAHQHSEGPTFKNTSMTTLENYTYFITLNLVMLALASVLKMLSLDLAIKL